MEEKSLQQLHALQDDVRELKMSLTAARTAASMYKKRLDSVLRTLKKTGPFVLEDDIKKLSGLSLLRALETRSPVMVFCSDGAPDVVDRLEDFEDLGT